MGMRIEEMRSDLCSEVWTGFVLNALQELQHPKLPDEMWSARLQGSLPEALMPWPELSCLQDRVWEASVQDAVQQA
jgi:hypothetical protein